MQQLIENSRNFTGSEVNTGCRTAATSEVKVRVARSPELSMIKTPTMRSKWQTSTVLVPSSS